MTGPLLRREDLSAPPDVVELPLHSLPSRLPVPSVLPARPGSALVVNTAEPWGPAALLSHSWDTAHLWAWMPYCGSEPPLGLLVESFAPVLRAGLEDIWAVGKALSEELAWCGECG